MERLIDTAAREMGIDRVELRRRNHIAPEQMPYKAPSGMNYDSRRVHRHARQGAGRPPTGTASTSARPRARARSKLRGRGIGHYLEVTGPPSKEYGGIRFEDDGTITMLTRHARLRPGPRHAVRPGAGRAARHPVRRTSGCCRAIRDQLKVGGGTGGSKSALVASQAFLEAGDMLIEQGKQIAAHVLEAAAADIEFARRPLHHRRHRPRHRHHRAGRASCAAG